MIDFDKIEGFQWDSGNINKNSKLHGVEDYEVEQVFFNKPVVSGTDVKHSKREDRYYALGKTDKDRRLFVVFTLRGTQIRVISARDMSKDERKIYNEKNKENSEI